MSVESEKKYFIIYAFYHPVGLIVLYLFYSLDILSDYFGMLLGLFFIISGVLLLMAGIKTSKEHKTTLIHKPFMLFVVPAKFIIGFGIFGAALYVLFK